MKTYLKTLLRMFTKHATRLISLIFIVLVSVGFVSGIGSATDKINYSLNDYYKAQNVSDFILKSTADGFTDEEIEAIQNKYGKANVETGMSVDVYLPVYGEEQLVRLYFFDELENKKINVFERITSGSVTGEHVVWAERADNKIKGFSLGDEITLDFKDILTQLAEQGGEALDGTLSGMLSALDPVTVTVGEIVASPLAFAEDGEASYLNDEAVLNDMPDTIDAVNSLITLENILYLPSDLIPRYRDTVSDYLAGFMSEEQLNTRLLGIGDIFIAASDRTVFSTFSKQYETYTDAERETITSMLDDVRVITLYDNYSFRALKSYSDKVMAIGYALMVAFLFVTALVAFSSMTRLLEEERAQIACLKTIGYSGIRILFKYLLFALIATGIGGVGSFFVGDGIARLLYFVFNYSFAMPPMSRYMPRLFFLLTYFFVVVATIGATAISGAKLVNTKPAELLRPKVPKAGRKVFLERIPFIWNKLSFTYKSTLRNVLRYHYRFYMTVIAVAVSTALVMAGLALLDVCLFGGLSSPSIMAVAFVVVIFAGLLTAVVIYTLTNINISERNRELATLMVLGYYDGEVSAYVYREIYIDTVVGIIFGYPLAIALMSVLFKIMVVGSIGGVSWFMWLLTPVIVLLFTFVVTMLLRRKIVKIDMNESLKAVE